MRSRPARRPAALARGAGASGLAETVGRTWLPRIVGSVEHRPVAAELPPRLPPAWTVSLRAVRPGTARQIGRASCGERVCQYVSISVVAVTLQKKKNDIKT